MRIDPGDAVPAAAGVLDRAGIAVRQHHRDARLVGGDRGGEARHYVGAVGEIGDAAKALRLALGEEAAVRRVESGELGVVLWRDAGLDLERCGVRHVGDQQPAVLDAIAVGAQLLAVQRDAQQRQRLAVQRQWGAGVARGRIAPHRHARANERRRLIEVERELDRIDQECGWPVVGQTRLVRRGRGRSGIDIEWHDRVL